MSLKKQTLSATVWTFIDTFALQGVSFVATLILARLLGPKEFGLMGMIALFVAVGNSLVDSGMSASVIRTKDANDHDFSTIFYTNIILSIVVYLLIFFAAPFIADFYNQFVLIKIIRVYCLSFIVSAFSATQIAVISKEMKFKRLMIANIPGTLLGVIIGVVMGYYGYGIWSIVFMYLTTQIGKTIVLWITSSWKPSFYFSKEKLRVHFNFGYKLMLSGLLNTTFSNIYNILIGKFYPVQVLGFYERANSFNQYPVTTLSGIIAKVTYPLLSSIQDEKKRISKVYKQILRMIFFITCPLMFGAAVIAKPLFLLVLGAKWITAVSFFQILSLSSMFLPIHAFNLNVLKVYGRSDLFLRLEIIKKVMIVVSVLISFQFGIYGLIWSSVFTSFTALIINTYYSKDLIDYTTNEQLLDMLPVFLVSLVTACAMYFILSLLIPYSLYIQIIIPALFGCIIYFLINFLIRAPSLIYSIEAVKKRL